MDMNMMPIYAFVKVTLVSSRGRYTLYFRIWSYVYSIFFPPRDEACGSCREEEIIMKLKKCRNYIFLMTEDFEIEGDSENALWCGLMWRNAWKNFR